MKIRIILLFLFILMQTLFATDEWRVFGPYHTIKSETSSPAFTK